MSEDIIIYPWGDFSNKLVCLMAAIDLQLKTKKKIKIVYSLSYNDIIWDNDLSLFIDELPDLKFNNITYEYETKNIKVNSALLKNILMSEHMSESLNKVSKNKKLNIFKFGIEYNEYPKIDKGIIRNTWIQGFKNKGAPLVKDWLSDVTKFKYYKKFEKEVGFDWYDPNYEYVVIYLEVGGIIKFIQNHSIANKFVLKPEWYDKALRILKNKCKKPLKIIYYDNLRLNSNLLFKYIEVFNKYGNIINDISRNNKSLQVEKLIIMSKVDHYIGSRNFVQLGSYLYAKNHSITIINSHNVLEYSYRKEDYPSNWMILNDENYRISSIRDLQRYNLDMLVGLYEVKDKESLEINKKSLSRSKNYISSKYELYYNKFDKALNSLTLKNLLLFKHFETKDKVYILNSNISINEGLFLFNLIKKYKPKKLMEIGLACGTSAAFMLLAMDKKSKLISVDPFQKLQWDSFGLLVVADIIKENKLVKTNHKWVPYFSHTFFNMKNNKFDFCFIDGDHSYEGTMIDLVGSHNLLEKDGLLVIDDVLHGPVKKALYDFLNNNSNMYKKIDNDLKTMSGYIKLK